MTTLVQPEDELQLATEVNTVSDVDGGGAWFSSNHENARLEDAGDGILRITLRPGGRITAKDGALVQERCLALTGGTGAAVLLQVIGVESIDRDAVRFFSEAVTIKAFAILGSTPVDRVIAHARHGLPAPQCPTRYFSDEQEALGWLRGLLAERAPGPQEGQGAPAFV
ncbi:DUF7793 family protein [Arthrobacter bambusae]|uniref:DUF7793 family protein n=1 Tax=Arthrobacter bambusae TaxID=1338426 RepID=UPI00277F0FDF|nr:hypothetical protein [Arthrobacter bambusae]MDQ0030823.1 hypothetical protein [Arthrobacter bambusae]MDQ0099188.1 hypothetical protein [Arthrobacter bambusae]